MPVNVVSGGEACFVAFFFALLMVAAIVDVRTRVIPDSLVLGIGALWLVRCIFRCLVGNANFVPNVAAPVLCALSVGVSLLCLTLVVEHVTKKPAFGGGDIKLISVVSLYFAPRCVLPFLLFVCISGIVCAIAYRLRGSKAFPFAPAITGGALIALAFMGL